MHIEQSILNKVNEWLTPVFDDEKYRTKRKKQNWQHIKVF